MSDGRLERSLVEKAIENAGGRGALATYLGVSPSLVRQLEDGYVPRRNADQILGRLAEKAGCSVAALYVLPPEANGAA